MLYIDKDRPNIVRARIIHIQKVGCRIRRRIGGSKCKQTDCEICSSKVRIISGVPKKLREILLDDEFLEWIIGGMPNEIYSMAEMLWAEMIDKYSDADYQIFIKSKRKKPKDRTFDEIVAFYKYITYYKLFLKIFDYDVWFINSSNAGHYDAYSLASGLDLRTCTYCNRMYTSTIKTYRQKKVMRPTFDHWFSHSSYPMLGISFYNLIPSCSICNSSVRGAKAYLLNSHFHPYVDKDILDHFQYGYHYYKTTNTYEIYIVNKTNSSKIFTTLSDLKLKEIYSSHISELADLIQIKKAYSEKYIENMLITYPGIHLSHNEAYRLAFGIEIEEKDFHKKPLSKFKKDILVRLNMLEF